MTKERLRLEREDREMKMELFALRDKASLTRSTDHALLTLVFQQRGILVFARSLASCKRL